MEYETQEMGKEEGQKLTEELQAVLAKYDAEMGVTSTITLLKRVPKDIPSPAEFLPSNGEITETDSETEEGS